MEFQDNDGPEALPADLKQVDFPPNFNSLARRILVRKEIDDGAPMGLKSIRNVVEGFEDVLGGDTLGAGHFFNTAPTVGQLCYALAISNHPFMGEIPQELTPRQIIEKLRELQVLKGMRIIDLGSGTWPAFALVATALGATVWTVDTERLAQLVPTINLERHIRLDLCEESAAEELLQKTSGNFNMLTESIIDTVPWNGSKIKKPTKEAILKIGHALLKPGGQVFFGDLRGILSRKTFQKK